MSRPSRYEPDMQVGPASGSSMNRAPLSRRRLSIIARGDFTSGILSEKGEAFRIAYGEPTLAGNAEVEL
jgi:hypothetical protein